MTLHAAPDSSAEAGAEPDPLLPPGTRRMIQRLATLRREAAACLPRNPFLSSQLVEYCRNKLAEIPAEHWHQRLELRLQLATHLLQSGQSEAALTEVEEIARDVETAGQRLDFRWWQEFGILHALCYLRIGEQENCLNHHTTESCLIPIRGGGVHQLRRGSRGAMQILSRHLEQYPSDLRAVWLLNVAAMTLGEYPDRVPSALRIPPKVFESDYDPGRFPDIAGAVGLDVDGTAGGSIIEDFDRDGNLDLLVSNWAMDGPLRFFRSEGNGTFTERTAEAGLPGLAGGLNLMQTDFNNDGDPDVFILRGAWLGVAGHHPNSLLRNRGDGRFEDVTEQAGLLSFHPTQAATWFDFDNDGWLDLFIGNESTEADPHPCELYRNNGDGTFFECAAAAGVAVTGFVKGVTSGDFNNDGRSDLYLSTRHGSNLLFRNDGPAGDAGLSAAVWKFSDVTAQAGVAEPFNSFPTWFWDFDNDGWLDLFVADYAIRSVGDVAADYLGQPHSAERARLYRNNADGTFTDVTVPARLDRVLLAMGANFGDLDNDGWLDFYVGTGDTDLGTLIPNRMFRNHEGRYFEDVTTAGGFGHIQKGHGVSFADLDNDGDQDVFVKIGGAYPGDNYRSSLFHNPGHANHWITIQLEGVDSNRAAIGARIRVVVETAQGVRTLHRTVGSGGSFGASPLRQAIGLGPARAIRAVEIDWPAAGRTQLLQGLSLDRFYRIREHSDSATVWNLKTFVWPSGAGPAHDHSHHAAAAGE